MKTSVLMRCPMCEQTSELDNLHLLDRSFKLKWVGLTDEEFNYLRDNNFGLSHLISAVEAKLKEKNNE